MPRIRTVKPEFWGDEKLAPMAPIDRLVFLGLLSFADDAGRLLDNEKAIDGFVFPESSDTSRESLMRLAEIGRIVRYVSDSGQRLIQVSNWKRHQRIEHPSKYVLPGPARAPKMRHARESHESLGKSSLSDLGPTTYDLRPTTTEQQPSRRKPRGEGESASRETWLTPTCGVWEAKYGAGSFAGVAGQAAKALAPLRTAGNTDAELGEHLAIYLERTEPRFVSLTRFAQTFAEWVNHPLVDENGFLNERGLAAMRSE
jgi:hypothetical protein